MSVITSSNIRSLIKSANAKGVSKEDIVDIKKLNEGEYVLIYYTYYTDEEP